MSLARSAARRWSGPEGGTRFRKALDTLAREAAQGKARPNAVEAFLAGQGVTLEAAVAWVTREATIGGDGVEGELLRTKADAPAAGNEKERLESIVLAVAGEVGEHLPLRYLLDFEGTAAFVLGNGPRQGPEPR